LSFNFNADEDFMRMLADLKVSAHASFIAWIGLALLLVCGCTTKNNPADLSSTEWVAKTFVQDGKSIDLADQKSELSLSRNGTFRWIKGTGTKRRVLEGSYELSAGNQVVMLLKDEVEGGKTHVAELTLSKDQEGNATKLVYKDDQGTIEYEPKK
jgi:hypothetical protein